MAKRGRKTGTIVLVFRLLAGLVAVGVVAGLTVGAVVVMDVKRFLDEPVVADGEIREFTIPEGTSWQGVVDRTVRADLVDSRLYFDLWGRHTGLAEEVRAGNFYLEGPMDLETFADRLREGGLAEEVQVTFREGKTKFHLVDRLEDRGLVDREVFLEVASEPGRYDWIGEDAETLEGYLFPETYRFEQGMPEELIVDRFVDQWRETVAPIFERHDEALEQLREDYGFSRHDVLTMASLIERETGVDDERDIIARVFYNRLDREMLLQTDPTCVYDEQTYDQQPTPELCNDPYNRYSTYVVEGLPPGPIANPSIESIEAALMPSDDPEVSDYLFFVSRRDGSGEHHFTTNYGDHRRAIQRFLRGN